MRKLRKKIVVRKMTAKTQKFQLKISKNKTQLQAGRQIIKESKQAIITFKTKIIISVHIIVSIQEIITKQKMIISKGNEQQIEKAKKVILEQRKKLTQEKLKKHRIADVISIAKIKISSVKKEVKKAKKIIRQIKISAKYISKRAIKRIKQISIPICGQAEAILKKVKHIPSEAKLKRVMSSRWAYIKHAKVEIRSLKKKIAKAAYDVRDLKKKLKSPKKKDAEYFSMKKLLTQQTMKVHKLRSTLQQKYCSKRKSKKIIHIFKQHAKVKKS